MGCTMRSATSTGILSLVALLGGALHADAQLLIVESNYGARCTVSTEGRQFGDFVVNGPLGQPGKIGMQIVHGWPDHFGKTITVTCSQEGFESKTMTFSEIPMQWISSGSPCGVEENQPIEPQVTYCLNYNEAHKMQYDRPPSMFFPRMIVPLDPKPNN
jgi:hypothetical protein